jgi:signal transduction histidine kinase
MNPGSRAGDAEPPVRAYFCGMKAPGRALAVDLSLAVIGVVLTAVAVWSVNVIATPFAGPAWLKVIWPLLIGAPLALRRRAPLLGWTIIWAGISLQALITGNSPEGVELMFVLGIGSYCVGAHSTLRRALAGLAVFAAGAVIYGQANHDVMSGNTGDEWSVAFFTTAILAAWLAGVFVRSRREAAAQAARTAAAERQAERAVADERARMARELHDIVSHNLSVVVLQAAGAQAAGGTDTGPTLEKIERSGRQALVEMRRLLGVLRQPDEPAAGPELSPQPGLAELAALAEGVRAAGLPVVLVIDGDPAGLPAAVDISAYRIVQEALTNVLKHAGPARAEVRVGCGVDEVFIEVTDDGAGPQPAGPAGPVGGGHGLAGMRERVALFGGELAAGPRPGGGFAVRARLPLEEQSRPAWPLP